MRASEMPAQAHVVAWAREKATEELGFCGWAAAVRWAEARSPLLLLGNCQSAFWAAEPLLGCGAEQQNASTIGPRAHKRAFGPRDEKKSAAGKQAFGLKYTVTSLKSVLLFQKHI
jgi:hypothetical protein